MSARSFATKVKHLDAVKIIAVKLAEYTLHLPLFFHTTSSNKYCIANIMGKGDPKTRRGKIRRGSHGKSRPKLQKLKTLLKKLVGK